MSGIKNNSKKRKTLNRSGFALIELIIAMTLSLLVMGATYSILIADQETYTLQDDIVRMQQNGRFTMTYICKKIRMAGFDPLDTNIFGITDSSYNFTNYTGAIVSASNSIFFTVDRDEDGTIDHNSNEKIGFRLNDTDGDGLSDSLEIHSITGGWRIFKKDIINFNVAYTYADGDTSAGTAGLPNNTDADTSNDLEDIRLVEITLTSRTAYEDRNFRGGFNLRGKVTDGTCRTYSLSAKINPRNIGL